MSCCGIGVGSEAMSEVLSGQVLIMVRMEKIQGEGYDTKMSISQEPSVRFASNLDTVYLRVCPTTWWRRFCGDDVTGVCMGAWTHRGWFSGRKTRKDTTWSVSIVFPGCPVSCITVIQWYSLPFHVRTMFIENKSSLRSMSSLRGKSSLPSKLPPWFIMKTLPGWLLEHNSLLTAKLIYMFALWYPDDMC